VARRRSHAIPKPFVLVTMILACQLVLCTLAADAFARYTLFGHNVAFALVLAPADDPDVLIVENYRTLTRLALIDTIPRSHCLMWRRLRHLLLRQTFKTVPRELDDAARSKAPRPCRCCSRSTCRWRGRLRRPYGLVSVSYHWNNASGR